MKYEIIYSETVNTDLLDIGDYIERLTFSKTESEKFVGELVSSIGVLSIFPYLYQKFYKDFYSINIKKLRIIYFINEQKKEVVIYRILSQYQNYQEII